ncbi:MAG: protein rep [Loktanella sp.]|nr:protein rep [Loktanella sp.]
MTAPAKAALRLARWAAKRKAAELVREVDPTGGVRLSKCGYCAFTSQVTLNADTHAEGVVSGSIGGVIACGNVWACPVCSRRISAQRADELNALLAWARAEGHAVLMVTTTFRHDKAMSCAGSVDALKRAHKRLVQSKGWRKLPLVGHVLATEVTHGQAAGWHPHGHRLVVLRGTPAEGEARLEAMREAWLACLAREGLTGNAHAWQVQPASAAGDYVAKFGAAEELTLGDKKAGRSGSRTPWQLLADARDGDARAGRLFQDYAAAFKGKRQLVWSHGLKSQAGIAEALEEGAEEKPQRRVVREWLGSSEEWRAARRRRCAMIAAVETGASVETAEHGATDSESWRAEREASTLIEGDDCQTDPAPISCAGGDRPWNIWQERVGDGVSRPNINGRPNMLWNRPKPPPKTIGRHPPPITA